MSILSLYNFKLKNLEFKVEYDDFGLGDLKSV